MTHAEKTNMVVTLIEKCIAIRNLLGKSMVLTHNIVGVPVEEKSEDEKAPRSSLEILSSELGTIQNCAGILYAQLVRIAEKIGSDAPIDIS